MKLPPGHVAGTGPVKTGGFGGFGQKMLERMGWSVGEGLGKNKEGITDAIRVKAKIDNSGLGAKAEPYFDPTKWFQVYDDCLRSLSEVRNDSGYESDSSDDSDCEITENPDGTKTSAKREELKIYDRLSRRSTGGQWASRRGKLKRIQKQEIEFRKSERSKKRKRS